MNQTGEKGKTSKNRIASFFDTLLGACKEGVSVEIVGRKSVTAGGSGRILLYTAERIEVESREGPLAVEGRNLTCTTYHPGAVTVEGEIDRISFLAEKGGKI